MYCLVPTLPGLAQATVPSPSAAGRTSTLVEGAPSEWIDLQQQPAVVEVEWLSGGKAEPPAKKAKQAGADAEAPGTILREATRLDGTPLSREVNEGVRNLTLPAKCGSRRGAE